MTEKEMNEMALDLVLPLYRWFGSKRILEALAEIEVKESREAGEGYQAAKHNAELLEDTARMLGE